jgi:hypothetical protein
MKKKRDVREVLREGFAAILRTHVFQPGEYPDPDYCSCGQRYGLYTKGDGYYPCFINMHVAGLLAEFAAKRKEARHG